MRALIKIKASETAALAMAAQQKSMCSTFRRQELSGILSIDLKQSNRTNVPNETESTDLFMHGKFDGSIYHTFT